MEQVTENKQIEVVYKKAKLSKRMFAHFIDIGLFFLATVITFSIVNMIVTHSGWFKSKDNRLTEIKNESGLFEDGVNVISYVDELKNDDDSPYSYEQRKS